MRLSKLIERGDDLDALAVALVPFPGSRPFRVEPLRRARLLQEATPLGEGPIGIGALLAGGRQKVAVMLQLGKGGLAALDRFARRGDGGFGALEPPWVLV